MIVTDKAYRKRLARRIVKSKVFVKRPHTPCPSPSLIARPHRMIDERASEQKFRDTIIKMARPRRDRRGDDRPRRQSPPRRPRSSPRRDDRGYRPNGGGESYRPGRDRSPRQNGYSNRAGPGDSFRPPQGDFTFRSGNNGPSFPPTGPSNDRSGRGGRKDRGRGGRVNKKFN